MKATDKDKHDACKIRSIRRRLRARKDDSDKKLIRLHKEEISVLNNIQNLGWKELDPPVQRGYVRFFVLRDDQRRAKDAAFFQKILDKVNTTQWSSKKEFTKRRRRYGKKIYAVREQNVRDVDEKEFFSDQYTERERSYFYETLTHPSWSRQPVKVFRFSEPWRFILRVQANMITKVRIKHTDLERSKADLERYFAFDNRRYRLWKLLHGNNRWRWNHLPGEKDKDPFRNKSFADVLDEYAPELELILNKRPSETPGVLFFHVLSGLACQDFYFRR
jgi:hypothetical protein